MVKKGHAYWGCTECDWKCPHFDVLIAHCKTVDEMCKIWERERDKAFAEHDCYDFPRGRDCK